MTNTPTIRVTASRRSGHAVVFVHRAGRPSRRYRVSLARYKQLRQRAFDWVCLAAGSARRPPLPGLRTSGHWNHACFRVNVWLVAGEVPAADALPQPVDAFGFTHQAPLLGTYPAAPDSHERRPVDRAGIASPCAHAARTEPLASALPASSDPVTQAQAGPASPSVRPDTATPAPGHESAPRSAAGESLQRPSDGSSCR